MQPLVIGLDLGTTCCKAVALTSDSQLLGSASGTYGLRSSRPGWAEQDPDELWQGVREALKTLSSKVHLDQATGLCLSGAMHSLFPVTQDGIPLAPAATWADNRAAPQARALQTQTDAHALYLRTGCPMQAIYHAARLRWWLEEAADVTSQAAHFVGRKEWLQYRLTGAWASDLGMASTTGLLDIHRLAWDEEALTLAGVTAERLPPLVSPTAVVGTLNPDAADETGLPPELPVVAGGNDGGLANLGSGVLAQGQVAITVGTSAAIRKVVERPLLDAAERTWCYLLTEGRWFAGGAINNGGLALQWVHDRFYPELPRDAGFRQVLTDAATISPGAEGLIFLPYLTGERSPHWDTDARALLYGLRLSHTRAHVARAALEGVAFCLADVWEALFGDDLPGEPVRLTGGITQSPLWTQILADVLGVPLAPIEVADASAVGAAMLGHQALGHVATLEEMAAGVQIGHIVQPDLERHAFYAEQHRVFQSLYQRLRVAPSAYPPAGRELLDTGGENR